MPATTLVQFRNITKKYHDLIAVNNLDLEIHEGEILGFVGPNGAGKTTTMKMLGGLINPTQGKIEINVGNGKFINTVDAPHEIYKNFGFLIDIPAFYNQVTPKKILKYYCSLLEIPKNQIEEKTNNALEIVDLREWKNKKIGEFSKGMIQRLGLAQAIVHDPKVAVLDEPQTGLDPAARVQVRNIMKKIKKMGKTIFLSSHMLYEIAEICDRIAIINRGELIAVDKLVNLEQKMMKKELVIELLEPLKYAEIQDSIQIITKKIEGYIEHDGIVPVIYDDALPGYHIFYDGRPISRKEIHDILTFELKLPIIGFSKIRSSRLEDLYMDLVNNNNHKVKIK